MRRNMKERNNRFSLLPVRRIPGVALPLLLMLAPASLLKLLKVP